ncbi:hypothetical protein GLOTRDRAFT_51224, partial [Gloeophyllum trabeum ATCC 11539]
MICTSPTKRARICHMKASGASNSEVAAQIGVTWSTVSKIYRWYQGTTDYCAVGIKTGRPCKFTLRDTRFAAWQLANTTTHNVADLKRQHFPDVSAETICRRMREIGLMARVRHKKPLLTPAHCQKQLERALAHQDWTVDDWKGI